MKIANFPVIGGMPEKFPPGAPASVNPRYCAEDEAMVARTAETMSIPVEMEGPQERPIEVLQRR